MRPLFEQGLRSGTGLSITVAAPAADALRSEGWAYDANGNAHIVLISDFVPATREMNQGLAFTPEGALYCLSAIPDGSQTTAQGFAITFDGALYIVSSSPPGSIVQAGLGFTDGSLNVSGALS